MADGDDKTPAFTYAPFDPRPEALKKAAQEMGITGQPLPPEIAEQYRYKPPQVQAPKPAPATRAPGAPTAPVESVEDQLAASRKRLAEAQAKAPKRRTGFSRFANALVFGPLGAGEQLYQDWRTPYADEYIQRAKEDVARLELRKEGIVPQGVGAVETKLIRDVSAGLQNNPDLMADVSAGGLTPRRAGLELARRRYADILGDAEASLPLLETVDGRTAVDLGAVQADLATVYMARQLRDNPQARPSDYAAMRKEADEAAETAVRKIKATVFDVPVIVDKSKAADWIMSKPRPLRPFLATLFPQSTVVEEGAITRREAYGTDPISYFGRIALSNLAVTPVLLAARKEYETPEDKAKAVAKAAFTGALATIQPFAAASLAEAQPDAVPEATAQLFEREGVEELMKAPDLLGAAHAWAQSLSALAPDVLPNTEVEKRAAEIFGYASVLGLVLLEPDPTLLVAPVGFAGKALSKTAVVGKTKRLAKAAQDARATFKAQIDEADAALGAKAKKKASREAAEIVQKALDDLSKTLGKQDTVLQRLAGFEILARLGRSGDMGKGARDILGSPIVRQVQKRIDKAKKAVDKLTTQHAQDLTDLGDATRDFDDVTRQLAKARSDLDAARVKARAVFADPKATPAQKAAARKTVRDAMQRAAGLAKGRTIAKADLDAVLARPGIKAVEAANNTLSKALKAYVSAGHKGFQAFQKAAVEGVDLTTTPLARAFLREIATAVDETLENYAQSFDSFGTFLKAGGEQPLMNPAARVIAAATTKISADKTAQFIDPQALNTALSGIDPAAVQQVINTHPSGPLLDRVLNGPAGAAVVPAGAATPPPARAAQTTVKLDAAERQLLEDALVAVEATARRLQRTARGTTRAETVMLAGRSADVPQAASVFRDLLPESVVPAMLDNFTRGVQLSARRLIRAFSPDQSRFGLIDDAIAQSYKAADVVFTILRAEIQEIGASSLQDLYKLADTTNPIQHARGATMANRFFAPESAWEKARAHLLDGVRVQEAVDAGKAGFEPWMVGADVQTSLEALARMWVGGGARTPPESLANDLRKIAVLILKDDGLSRTFEDFATNMRQAYGTGRLPDGQGGTKAIQLTTAKGKSYTFKPIAKPDPRYERSVALALSAVYRAAMVRHTTEMLVRAGQAPLNATKARRINNLMEGEMVLFTGDYKGKAQDVRKTARIMGETLDALLDMGMPFVENKVSFFRAVGQAQDANKKLLALEMAEDGSTHFVPQILIRNIDEAFGRIVKEFEPWARTKSSPVQKVIGFFQGLVTWIKTSWTTGWMLAKPSHGMANSGLGDPLAQVLPFIGVRAASRQMLQGITQQIPGYNRIVAAASRNLSDRMKARLGAAGDVPLLGPIVDSMFRPDVSAVFTGVDTNVILGGNIYTTPQLRQMLMEDGILQSQAHEEIARFIGRRASKAGWFPKTKDAMAAWQHEIVAHVDMSSQRQRVGFYFDRLAEGRTQKEARDLTLSALYDWKHGYAEWETAAIVAINVPFYRWARNAYRQMGSALLAPFVRPDEAVKQAMFGLTPVGVTTKIDKLRDSLAGWYAVGMEDDEAGFAASGRAYHELDRLGAYVDRSAWYANRFWMPRAASPERAEWYALQGQQVTHQIAVSVPMSNVEVLNALLGSVMLAGLFGVEAMNLAGAGIPIHMTPNAVDQLFTENLADQFGGATDILRAFESAGDDRRLTWVSPQEAKTLAMLDRMRPWSRAVSGEDGWTPTGVHRDTESGRWTARRSAVLMLRASPLLLQIPGYVRAIHEGQISAYGESRILPRYTKFMAGMLGDLYGPRRVTAVDVFKETEQNIRAIEKKLDALEKQYIDSWGPPPKLLIED